MNCKKPLDGIRVVELSTHIALPSCGKLLAYLGADVIKIESTAGEPYRLFKTSHLISTPDEAPLFDALNSQKKSFAADLKSEKLRPYIYKMIEQSDVFMSNVRAGALDRMGLSYEKLKEINPKLVYALFSAYGPKGPLADMGGFDSTAFYARSGIYRDSSAPETAPTTHISGSGDMTSGMGMAIGILGALMQVKETGIGVKVTSALNQASTWIVCMALVMEQYGSHFRLPANAPRTTTGGNYLCSDGNWVIFSALKNDSEWFDFCNALSCEYLLNDERFKNLEVCVKNISDWYPIIKDIISRIPSKELVKRLRAKDLVCEIHGHIVDIPKDEQIRANGFVYDMQYSSRTVALPEPPFTYDNIELQEHVRGPRLGEHTVEILKGLGCSEEEIGALISEKAIVP